MKVLVALLVSALAFIGGGVFGFMRAYGEMAPVVEERVISDANKELLRNNIRRYEFVLESGKVLIVIRPQEKKR